MHFRYSSEVYGTDAGKYRVIFECRFVAKCFFIIEFFIAGFRR